MTTGAVLRAAAQVGAAYALIGVGATLVLALAVGEIGTALLPAAVLAVALLLAALIVVVLARLAVSSLQGRVREPVVGAIMLASALVLLSGVLTVPSLGISAVAVSALMALATHVVLTRRWT